MARILIIEDEDNVRFSLTQALNRVGHEVSEAGNVTTAWKLVQQRDFDLILTDVNLEGEDGVELVSRAREEGFDGAIIVVTAYGTVDNAVRAMKCGADDYLQKPLRLDELALLVEKMLDARTVKRRLNLYKRMESQRSESRKVLGESAAWKRTLDLAARVARAPIPTQAGDTAGGLPSILLLGETGAGKGALARFIHEEAERSSGASDTPFVHLNCTAIPPQLVESELFGHEKGAFTDAKSARLGLFEMADGGTIFLDEIGDMPIGLQSKLLVVAEEGRFRRVGGTKDRFAQTRVIAATNQNLDKRVEEGEFRRDLLYRLNTFTVTIPPLRDREGDAVLLAEVMLDRFGRQYGREGMVLSDAARQAIQAHHWPGNVRELSNLVQRAAMLADAETIEPEDLSLGSAAPLRARPIRPTAANGSIHFDFDSGIHTADEVEKSLMMQALQRTKGNVSKAAKLIGMQRSSFRYRIERYGLEEVVQEISSK